MKLSTSSDAPCKRSKGMEERQHTPPRGSFSSSSSCHPRSNLDHIRLPFAYKLHILLCDMEVNSCEHIISWVEDGKAFKIHDRKKFEVLIQPHYFRQSTITSFIRQVRRDDHSPGYHLFCSVPLPFISQPLSCLSRSLIVLCIWILQT